MDGLLVRNAGVNLNAKLLVGLVCSHDDGDVDLFAVCVVSLAAVHFFTFYKLNVSLFQLFNGLCYFIHPAFSRKSC